MVVLNLLLALVDSCLEVGGFLGRHTAKRRIDRGVRSFKARHNIPERRFVLGRAFSFSSRTAPLSVRDGHVLDEDSFIPLEDTQEPFETEYVVQLHEAERAGRHFDLRIAYKGQAVSWAIPMKGKRAGFLLMPKPGERWLAVRQPDHVLEYMDWEGTIDDGFGKGEVSIWARGRCDIHKIEDGNVHQQIYDGPAAGSYVIVQTQGRLGLIISKEPIWASVWSKPRYGKREASELGALEDGGRYIAERKVDGAHVELSVGEYPTISSHRISERTGHPVEHGARLPHIIRSLHRKNASPMRLRAEAWHPKGVEFLAGTLNSGVMKARDAQKRAGPIRLDIFDIIEYEGQDVSGLPYEKRRELYIKACEELSSPYVKPIRGTRSGFTRFYNEQVGLKGAPTDGIVLKRLDAAYDEVPSIKVKPSDLADCTVLKVDPGTGKYRESLGAIVVQTPEGKQVRVGTGFTDRQRQWIWQHRSDLEGETARVAFHVRFGDRTATGPRFSSWHPDKSDMALNMYSELGGS